MASVNTCRDVLLILVVIYLIYLENKDIFIYLKEARTYTYTDCLRIMFSSELRALRSKKGLYPNFHFHWPLVGVKVFLTLFSITRKLCTLSNNNTLEYILDDAEH